MKLNKWKGVAITAVFSIVTSFTPSMQTIEAAEINDKLIALTFDDGPNTTTTNDVLDILEEYDAKASFF